MDGSGEGQWIAGGISALDVLGESEYWSELGKWELVAQRIIF